MSQKSHRGLLYAAAAAVLSGFTIGSADTVLGAFLAGANWAEGLAQAIRLPSPLAMVGLLPPCALLLRIAHLGLTAGDGSQERRETIAWWSSLGPGVAICSTSLTGATLLWATRPEFAIAMLASGTGIFATLCGVCLTRKLETRP
ncbi:MAG: hypothetical protein HY360_14680 [Verrucomicrobia bacterium]|nr:hypothetical protein [Verrucomicrobiota bacterium]